MDFQLKRTFQGAELSQLAVYAVTGSVMSVYLSHMHYIAQFAGSLLVVAIEFGLLNFSRRFDKYEKLLSLSLLSVASFPLWPGFLSSLFISWLIVIPHILFDKHELLSLAILGQLSDIISSKLVLESGSELNPVASYLINNFGVIPGLAILKTLMIGFPILWAFKALDKDELDIFLKILFLLGVAMAARNFMFL